MGGHTISATSVARTMKRRGHTVFFAGGRGTLTELIETDMPFFEIPIPLYHGSRETNFTWKSFPAFLSLKKVVENLDLDIIHAFDERAYILSHMVGFITDKPVTCTLCGGLSPHYNIPFSNKIIVFSEEQKNKMLFEYGWQEDLIEIIRTRLDIHPIINGLTEPLNVLIPGYILNTHTPILMMISRFAKKDSMIRVLESIKILLNKGLHFYMIFIGGEGDRFEEFRDRCKAINDTFDCDYLILTGQVLNAYRLLAHADVVLGIGRSAFEGMAYGKPTLIVGDNGFAGLVQETTLTELGYYNFSGRNQRTPCPPEILAKEIEILLLDGKKREKSGEGGKKFVMDEINVEAGAERIEKVYEQCISGRTLRVKISQSYSIVKILIPVWIDNFYHTLSTPIKKMLKANR